MKTIEKIHNEFDSAVEVLEKISNEKQEMANSISDNPPDTNDNDGVFLLDLGFSNTTLAKKSLEYRVQKKNNDDKRSSYLHQSKAIKENVDFYKNAFPFHKFILYSQVLQICEKYNLYLGSSSLYKGDIPKKNIEEMKNFPLQKYQSLISQCVPFLSSIEPICSQLGNTFSTRPRGDAGIHPYICAPYSSFETKNTDTVGKEIFSINKENGLINPFKFKIPKPEPKDPIVLLPVTTKQLKQIGFIVVTKWGKEAEDESLVVPKNN